MSSSDENLDKLAPYKVRIRKEGRHVHVTVFSRAHHSGETFANCGSLCFDEEEWDTITTGETTFPFGNPAILIEHQ